MSEDWLKQASRPVLLFFHIIGFQTLEIPQDFPRNKLCNLAWNIPTILFFLSLTFVFIMEAVLSWLHSDKKSQLVSIFIAMLIMSAYLSLFRARHNIKLLLSKLSAVSQIVHSAENIKLFIAIYCCIMVGLNLCIEISLFKSKMRDSYRDRAFESDLISKEFKRYFLFAADISSLLSSLSPYLACTCFSSYYFLVCLCMKKILSEIVSKSKDVVVQCSRQSGSIPNILKMYEEITEAMAFAEHFLSYYVFIFVLISLCGLFWFSYIFATFIEEDYYSHLLIIWGIVYYFLLLLSLMLPAAAVNKSVETARSTIKLMGSCIPHSCRDLDAYLRQRWKPRVGMTLWKIYKIDKSLLICSLGTLLTYGMLLGTLGSANKQNNMSPEQCVCMMKG